MGFSYEEVPLAFWYKLINKRVQKMTKAT